MFYPGTITQALQRSELLAWPLLLFVAEDTQVVDCLELIEKASLETCAVLQLIQTGTEEHEQFQSFVKETETPRVHIFAPKKHRTGLPPMAVMGKNFNSTHITEAVNIALEWSDGYTKELMQHAARKVEAVSNECVRYRRVQDTERMKASAPLFASAKTVAPAARTTTADSAPNSAAGPSQQSTPHGAAPTDHHPQHNIHRYVELSVCDKVSVVAQHEDTMSVASLWDMAVEKGKAEPSLKSSTLSQLVVNSPDSDVRRHVKSRAEATKILVSSLAPKTVVVADFASSVGKIPEAHASQGAHPAGSSEGKHHIHHYVELSVRDKVTVVTQREASTSVASLWDMAVQQTKGDIVMQLVITSPESEVKTHVKSRNEASNMLVSSLVPKSVVTAVLASRDPNAPLPAAMATPDVVCTGDQCTRRASQAPTAASSNAPTAISVRCQLPTGAFIMASDLTPDSTLDSVRAVVAKHLGHDAFAIYNSYPPRRFADQEMHSSLRALGLERNATVRITMTASLQQPPAGGGGTQTATPSSAQHALGSVPGLLGSSVGRLADMFRGMSGTSTAPNPSPGSAEGPAHDAHRATAAAPQPKRAGPRFGTIASLHSADPQDGDRHDADEGDDPDRPRKSNRYYGGASTEYEAKKK